ncbi:hypothetical protein [Sinomonas terrae]|uniref:ABC transporter permease n=1 Tax=Sinomonas terrae TaxID=2908838 RepID=A0ABS9TXY5_9MICC|nr:hypothetical protein [Sinomonas terrae]MCH6469284.1 hypothetical protein [Sinomonas terrae]
MTTDPRSAEAVEPAPEAEEIREVRPSLPFPPTSAVRTEARAVQMAGLAVVVSFVAAFIAFAGRRPSLSGDHGVGDVAGLVGGAVAVIVLPLAYRHTFDHPQHHWLVERPAWRRYLGVLALAVVHGAIAFMAAWAGFRIFQQAFGDLTFDPFAGAIEAAVVGGLSAYATYQSGARMNSYLLSNLLATYLAAGVLTSMVTTKNPNWWEINFSALGAANSGVAWTFNVTLVTGGIVITMLAEYVTRDIQALAAFRADRFASLSADHGLARRGRRPGRTTDVRTRPVFACLVLMGLMLTGTGLVPVDVYMPGHNIFATSMSGTFVVLVVGLPWWLPGVSRTFQVTGFVMLGGAVLAVVLWYPLGYYNMTAMEMFVAGVVLGWLVLLIRNLAAAVEDARRTALSELLGS